jgi:thiol-disulfide isomerase/thioredoxin
MRKILIWALFLFAPSFVTASPWRTMDTQGTTHTLPDPDRKITVLIFLGPECPISQRYAPTLKRLHESFKKEVDFFGVVSGSFSERKSAAQYQKEFQLPFPILFDASEEIARELRPTHVPEVFLLDAKQKLSYRGRIDDWYDAPARPRATVTQHDLRDALEAILKGKSPSVEKTKPVGCLFEDLPAEGKKLPEKVTFNRHIAPIVFAQCVDCHRTGEVAPFALSTYQQVSKRSKQILQVTKDRTMPPWHAAKDYGHFQDERRLTGNELALLEAWVQAGSPEGDANDLPPAPSYPDGWRLGKPDLIVRMPEKFTVPAEGSDLQQNFVIPLNVTEDKMVGAIEFRPGNPKVVHHAICFLDSSGAARKLDAKDPKPGYSHDRFGLGFFPSGGLGGWAPGNRPRWVPEGMGRFLQKGSDMVMQVHYHPSGKDETDQSEVGIYFVRKPAPNMLGGFAVENWEIEIEPNEKSYRRKASYTLPVDTTIIGVAPHMHLLGKEMKCWAELQDGSKLPLVHIPRWNFNWQDEYFYRKPFTLKRGTKLLLEAEFDNSEANPFNPSRPPKKITWGEGTNDEMCVCIFEVTCNNIFDLMMLVADDVRQRDVIRRFQMRWKE